MHHLRWVAFLVPPLSSPLCLASVRALYIRKSKLCLSFIWLILVEFCWRRFGLLRLSRIPLRAYVQKPLPLALRLVIMPQFALVLV